ncbi:hypothetical protein BGX24_008273 [Mortierella sp. AD032]|nr:hypothetical protein BGX24_008273 [Mortierella sp. AD032]
MSRYHAQPNTIPPGTVPLPALNRVLKAIDAKDVITQLAVISDDQLINDTQLHIRLLELEDLYVQFSAYRLVKAILLNHNDVFATISATDNNSQSPLLLRSNRQLVIRMLVQKLVKINQSCSGTGRAILELFHGLLKDHRHLVRNLGYHDIGFGDDSEEEEDAMLAVSQHVALTVMEELMACSEFRDGVVLNKILDCREMQYAALIFIIDIEKARVFGTAGAGDGFWKSVISCHKSIVHCLDKWMAKDRIGLLPLKKHLELICISMKPSSPSQQQRHERSTGQDMQRALEVLIALSPLLLDTLQKFQEQDLDLEDFSAGRTTFIVPDNPTSASLSNNPEAVRQLGQICLTAALSILDNLDLPGDANQKGDGIRNYHEQIIELTSRYLIPFLEEWLGDRTLPLLLTIYGEDDAGISWLLRTINGLFNAGVKKFRVNSCNLYNKNKHRTKKNSDSNYSAMSTTVSLNFHSRSDDSTRTICFLTTLNLYCMSSILPRKFSPQC